jgi:amidohydrolase
MQKREYPMKRNLILVIVLIIPFAGPVSAETLREAIAVDFDANLEALFRHFHANPELSHREFKTAKRLATEIREFGFDVTEGVGGTGIVAVMENGPGPVVMLRADMDGLPLTEDTGLPYASKARQVDITGIEQPVMHACGHDVHITAMVGVARQMAARRNLWSGTLVMIGQPAEERISGARAMLADGLYERFPKPQYALAFHVSAGRPAGKIQVRLANTGASSDSVDIIVHGVGAHGASPHKGIDPVLVASQIVVTLQSVVSRSIAPLQPGVITVGAIHGGSKHNIISDRVEMQLTVRADDPETRQSDLYYAFRRGNDVRGTARGDGSGRFRLFRRAGTWRKGRLFLGWRHQPRGYRHCAVASFAVVPHRTRAEHQIGCRGDGRRRDGPDAGGLDTPRATVRVTQITQMRDEPGDPP